MLTSVFPFVQLHRPIPVPTLIAMPYRDVVTAASARLGIPAPALPLDFDPAAGVTSLAMTHAGAHLLRARLLSGVQQSGVRRGRVGAPCVT